MATILLALLFLTSVGAYTTNEFSEAAEVFTYNITFINIGVCIEYNHQQKYNPL